jgi:transcriptional regulator with XRE-family HTH domain
LVNSSEIRALRKRLGLSQSGFAQLVGADLRSVIRWENGAASPSGAPAAVLTALQTALSKSEKPEDLISFVLKATAVGGLAYLLITLLEEATTPKRSRAKRRSGKGKAR